jgi:uncharacterized protein (DUF1800 family)
MPFTRFAALPGGLLLVLALTGAPAAFRSPEAPPAGIGVGAPAPALDVERTTDRRVAHVLSRLTFGARPGDAERVRTMGIERWIDTQLRPERIADTELERFVAEHYPTIAMSPRDLYQRFPPPGLLLAEARRSGAAIDTAKIRRQARGSATFVTQLLSARVARAVMGERQLDEVMVDFWLNHFSVYIGKGQTRYYLASFERDAIRAHVLGRFRDLLGSVAHSPAMLFYLDNVQSVADSGAVSTTAAARRGRVRPDAQPRRRSRGLNENYARELLELHTLGVDGGYTQHDVTDVARALTGWGIVPPRGEAAGRLEALARRGNRLVVDGDFLFRPDAHDAGTKSVLGVPLPAGRGMEDGEQVLDILARHPSTARFIARKLATRFVSDSPPPALVDRAAATFLRTDGDIREVVRTIVTSPEFMADDAYRAKVKTPFEVVVSALRAMGAGGDPSRRTAQVIGRLGQPLYGHQAPDGWPDDADAWMNTGAILNRINFGLAFAAGRVPGARIERWPVARTLRGATREQQVNGIIDALLAGDASPETRRILMTGENPLARDTTTMTNDGVARIVGLALGSPEFQRK